MIALEDISESSTSNILSLNVSSFNCEAPALNHNDVSRVLGSSESKQPLNYSPDSTDQIRADNHEPLPKRYRSEQHDLSPLSNPPQQQLNLYNDHYVDYNPTHGEVTSTHPLSMNGYSRLDMYSGIMQATNNPVDQNGSFFVGADGTICSSRHLVSRSENDLESPNKVSTLSSYYANYQQPPKLASTVTYESMSANLAQSTYDDYNGYNLSVPHDSNHRQLYMQATYLQEASEEETQKLDYLKTVEFLKHNNLFDVTMRTADLLKRNSRLQKELDKFKGEVAHFLIGYNTETNS